MAYMENIQVLIDIPKNVSPASSKLLLLINFL